MFFFFNDTATTEIYTLSLHDALPILGFATPCSACGSPRSGARRPRSRSRSFLLSGPSSPSGSNLTTTQYVRSEEHTSELQSRQYLVCRLLLEQKKNKPLATSRCSNTI